MVAILSQRNKRYIENEKYKTQYTISERKRIYLCLAHMSENGAEQHYVKEAFDTNWVVPLGPNVNGFEKDMEEFIAPEERGDGYLFHE